MSPQINFSTKYSYRVQVTHAELGGLGAADLSFGLGSWPHLVFSGLAGYSTLKDEMNFRKLLATTEDGGELSLFDCSLSGLVVSIGFVVAGDMDAEFKGINIRFFDINEWFMPFRKIEEKLDNEGSLGRAKQIDVRISTDQQNFTLSSKSVLQIWEEGEDHIVHEHIIFTFNAENCLFSLDDLRRKPLELATLLSILVATPMYLSCVGVVSTNGQCGDAFFPTFERQNVDERKKTWANFFVRKPLLDDRWQDIFNNYYQSEYRAISWVRLAGMQHYNGFWEFRTLGYVSLLDRYVSQRCKGMKQPKSKRETRMGSEIPDSLKNISPALTPVQIAAVQKVIQERFMNGKELNFIEKLNHVLDQMNEKIRSIINLTSANFTTIKEIRDAIAHGNAPKLPEGEHTQIGIVVSKIELLLTYFAFHDFGISDESFLACLSSLSSMAMGANIDGVELARVTKSAGFFEVPKDQFEIISNIKGIKVQACFIRSDDGHIQYSEELTSDLKAWYDRRVGGVIPVEEIFKRDKEKITCYGTVYIESGSERLEIFQSYFVDMP